MFDTEEKLWLVAITMIIIMALPAVFFIYRNIEGSYEQCNLQGGIMVKTMDGWRCIDSKVLL
jgi:hypothetical protein